MLGKGGRRSYLNLEPACCKEQKKSVKVDNIDKRITPLSPASVQSFLSVFATAY